MKKVNLSTVEVWALMSIFVHANPRTSQEQQVAPAMDGIVEWLHGDGKVLGVIDSLKEKGMITYDEQTGDIHTTRAGSDYALKTKSSTPDFQRLADSDVSTAMSMLFKAFQGLTKHIGDKPIVAGKSDSLVVALRDLRNWIDEKIGGEVTVAKKATRVRKESPKVDVQSFNEIANNETGEAEDALVQQEIETV